MLVFGKYICPNVLLPMNVWISFGMRLTPKLSKYVIVVLFEYKATQQMSISAHSSRLVTYSSFFHE